MQLRRVTSCLTATTDSSIRTPTHRWLFPRLQDITETMSYSDFDLKPFVRRKDVQSLAHSPLNEQQKLAIKRVVVSHRTVPYLIVGPPGTGKRPHFVIQVARAFVAKVQPSFGRQNENNGRAGPADSGASRGLSHLAHGSLKSRCGYPCATPCAVPR
jgi:hypothetical protein